jgi:hypothetical protein
VERLTEQALLVGLWKTGRDEDARNAAAAKLDWNAIFPEPEYATPEEPGDRTVIAPCSPQFH